MQAWILLKSKSQDFMVPQHAQIQNTGHGEIIEQARASQIHTIDVVTQQVDSDRLHYIFRWANTTEAAAATAVQTRNTEQPVITHMMMKTILVDRGSSLFVVPVEHMPLVRSAYAAAY